MGGRVHILFPPQPNKTLHDIKYYNMGCEVQPFKKLASKSSKDPHMLLFLFFIFSFLTKACSKSIRTNENERLFESACKVSKCMWLARSPLLC